MVWPSQLTMMVPYEPKKPEILKDPRSWFCAMSRESVAVKSFGAPMAPVGFTIHLVATKFQVVSVKGPETS
jgi:hypothetical protein